MDDDGRLRQFADVYGHERRIALGLEGKAHLIVRARENEPDPPAPKRFPREADKAQRDWRRQIFDN